MLAIVVRARLRHPPCRCIASGRQRVPDLEHPIAGCLRLGQDDAPRADRSCADRNSAFSASMSRSRGSIGAGFDSSELDPGLGQPRSEVGDEIGDRPVWVAVVAGPDDLGRIERMEELKQLMPSGPLGLDLGVERVAVRARPVQRSEPRPRESMG